MTIGAILTLGIGAFSDVNHVVTLGYGSGATPTPTPTPTVTSGGSGRRYPIGNLDLGTWRKKGKRLEAKIAKLEERIEAKREKLDGASLETVKALKKQIIELQTKLLELLAELDFARKGLEESEMEDVMAAYLAYRRLH